jgi:DNA-binding PadR family transcriptional regulator
VLALLAERPAHGFALSRRLAEEGEIGQVWTMLRPRVCRALEAGETEPSDRGPARAVFSPDPGGAGRARARLAQTEAARDCVGDLIAPE